MHVKAEALGGGGKPLILGPACFIGGKAQAARHFPARRQARFGIKLFVKIHRIAQHLRDRGG